MAIKNRCSNKWRTFVYGSNDQQCTTINCVLNMCGHKIWGHFWNPLSQFFYAKMRETGVVDANITWINSLIIFQINSIWKGWKTKRMEDLIWRQFRFSLKNGEILAIHSHFRFQKFSMLTAQWIIMPFLKQFWLILIEIWLVLLVIWQFLAWNLKTFACNLTIFALKFDYFVKKQPRLEIVHCE